MSAPAAKQWLSALVSSGLAALIQPPLYFYRDSSKKEIDRLFRQDGVLTPVEIKKGSAPKDAIKNFSVLAPIEKEPREEDVFAGAAHLKTEIGTGAVICMPADMIPIDEQNWYIPAWLI